MAKAKVKLTQKKCEAVLELWKENIDTEMFLNEACAALSVNYIDFKIFIKADPDLWDRYVLYESLFFEYHEWRQAKVNYSNLKPNGKILGRMIEAHNPELYNREIKITHDIKDKSDEDLDLEIENLLKQINISK